MSYKGYDFFYTNGSSHTKGGGFETIEENGWFSESMASYYLQHYNVTWKSCNEVNYATRLAGLLDINVVNEAMQGGGLDRVIRKTYEFIESNWILRGKYFIILETPDASRIDLYYKPWDKFLVANHVPQTNTFYGTTSYFSKPDNIDEIQPDVRFYYDKFYDEKQHKLSNERKLMGLYCFCKAAGIPIKLMSGFRPPNFQDVYQENDIISGLGNDDYDIIEWCISNKKQIKHETKNEVIDGHPGYFAHIEYAQIWKDWLDKNLEYSNSGTK